MNEPKKPTSIVREETIAAIADVINKSELPPFVIEPILQNFLTQTTMAMQNQYKQDMQKYQTDMKAYKDNKEE